MVMAVAHSTVLCTRLVLKWRVGTIGRVNNQSAGGPVLEAATVFCSFLHQIAVCERGHRESSNRKEIQEEAFATQILPMLLFHFSQLSFQDLLSKGSCFLCFSMTSQPGVITC